MLHYTNLGCDFVNLFKSPKITEIISRYFKDILFFLYIKIIAISKYIILFKIDSKSLYKKIIKDFLKWSKLVL